MWQTTETLNVAPLDDLMIFIDVVASGGGGGDGGSSSSGDDIELINLVRLRIRVDCGVVWTSRGGLHIGTANVFMFI